MAANRRRTTLGLYPSAALPLLWEALEQRGWTDADFARECGLTSGGASKVLYGDVETGRRVASFCERVLGVPFGLWDEPCPYRRRSHPKIKARKPKTRKAA